MTFLKLSNNYTDFIGLIFIRLIFLDSQVSYFYARCLYVSLSRYPSFEKK